MRHWQMVIRDPPRPAVGRNDPCPCGGGLKYKKCHGARKPRTRKVTLDFGRPVYPDEIHVSASGAIQLRRRGVPFHPVAAETEESYPRSKGPKTLYRFPPGTVSAGTNPSVLLERYDHVFAIDTNTVRSSSGSISMTAIVGCTMTVSGTKLLAQPYVAGTWQSRDNPTPETSAWRLFLEFVAADQRLASCNRIALVVDHDLDKLDFYNRREKAIHLDFMLPENVDLIYAADSGTDFLGSQLIRICHEEAAYALDHLDQRAPEQPAV